MRVLVTGAGGQLGLDLLDAFADHAVVGLTHADLDVAEEPAVVAAVRDHAPDLVLHAAAWTDVDGCEEDPDRAHRVNALGAWWVARACALTGAAMVYFSTDYVFGGGRFGPAVGVAGGGEPPGPAVRDDRSAGPVPGGRVGSSVPEAGAAGGALRPFTEFDPPDPCNAYGRSKAAGEDLVRTALDRHYVVRTSWVCGARGGNFVATMLRVGRERGEARVVDDQVGCPTFTRDLARAVRELAVTGRHGTYHRTNTGSCTWYDLAAATFELAGLEVDLEPQSSADLDRPAPRPAYAVLGDRHSVLSGLSPLPSWREGLEALLAELGELQKVGG